MGTTKKVWARVNYRGRSKYIEGSFDNPWYESHDYGVRMADADYSQKLKA
jgi:hypothetical protein